MSEIPPGIARSVLPSGLVVITEKMPHVRSISAGFWLRTGSRAEPSGRNGIAHFIEHMVFKGTERRSAEEIAQSVDSVGGMLDAFTGKETTCFNAKVLDEHLPLAFDVLTDLVLRPRFAEEDIAKEKQIVLEEIKMDEDNPEYLIQELFTQNFWRGHPLGLPILGTPGTVPEFTRGALLENFRAWYAPNNIVLTAAGNLEHAQLVEMATQAFVDAQPAAAAHNAAAPETHAGIERRNKRELEQVHIVMGVPSYPFNHEGRYAASLLNTILGGGMSSRLFQNIREKQGLAYAIFSELSPYSDSGALTVYAGTARESAALVIRSVIEELRRMKQEPVTAEELRRAKDHLKGSLMLSLESTSSRMSHLARQEMYFQKFFTMDELLRAVEGVTSEEVHAIAREFFTDEHLAITVLGNLDGFAFTRDSLN